jgi:hypothetical protein
MLSLEAPAKRSRETVQNWFRGVVINPKTKKENPGPRPPQFLQGSAMYSIFGEGA